MSQNEILTPEMTSDLQQMPQVGAQAAVAREQAEIQAAIVLARKFPRNEQLARDKALLSFERPRMAEDAQYSFPRGGRNITGPSIHLAVELARCWGNIRSGIRVVSMSDDTVHIRGFAMDVETNISAEFEDEFKKLIQRKDKNGQTLWIKPDERDLRELINRRGAILVRNAILRILPPDLVEDAERTAQETLEKAMDGPSRQEKLNAMTLSFTRLGVKATQLEKKMNCKLEAMSAENLAELRKIYKAIIDGQSTVAEQFDVSPISEDQDTAELNKKMKRKDATDTK